MKKHIFFAALTAGLLLSACNKEENGSEPNNNGSVPYKEAYTQEISNALVCGKQKTVSSPSINQWEYRKMANGFYWKFADAVGGSTTDNIAVSPISAFLVLGMAAESAAGDTQKELLDAIGVSAEQLPILAQILSNDLNRSLGNDHYYNEDGEYVKTEAKNIIKSVNSIWACDRIHYNEDGLYKVSADFYCDLFRTDFLSGEGNRLINAYVKNETRGFLDINLEIPKSTVMALMNVLYLKEIWNKTGSDLTDTKDIYDFENTDKSIVSKKLLNGYYHSGRAMKTEKFRKFYAATNNGFRLTFIVPNDGYAVSDIYNYETLADSTRYTYTEGNKRYHTRCFFPEFKTEFFQSIKESIQKLGISSLFVDGGCDFSNLVASIDGATGVYCSDVKQATRFEVQRSGIEGAAVTIMLMDAASSPGPGQIVYEDVYEDFIVDRAFAYTFEDPYGNVLFTGVVNKIDK